MYTNWQDYINDFKSLAYPSPPHLGLHRLSISEEELHQFWSRLTLRQIEQLFTITNTYILTFIVSQLLQPYLHSRKLTHEAYTVSRVEDKGQEQTLLYTYDCRLFRSSADYTKEENEFISSFLLVYREEVPISESLYEVVDVSSLPASCWALKVKESSLLRTWGLIQETTRRVRHRTDRIILEEDKYYDFMEQWLKCYFNYKIEITLSFFFRAILILLENQVLLAYSRALTPQQRIERMYRMPVRSIEKPKNVEQFTLTEGNETETKWQTLKVTAFKLKYRVEEAGDNYICYRVQEQEEQPQSPEMVTEEDRLILEAFRIEEQASFV